MRKFLLATLTSAGLAAAGAVQAAGTFDAPQRAGEASTMTQGRPNLETNNMGWPRGTRVVGQTAEGFPILVVTEPLPRWHPSVVVVGSVDTQPWHSDATPTTNIPVTAGEASTMTNGRPNLITNNWQSPRLSHIAAGSMAHYPYR